MFLISWVGDAVIRRSRVVAPSSKVLPHLRRLVLNRHCRHGACRRHQGPKSDSSSDFAVHFIVLAIVFSSPPLPWQPLLICAPLFHSSSTRALSYVVSAGAPPSASLC